MSNYDHILNNINKSSIDLSTSNKYDEIIELYKMIVVKLIMSCELTLYKICSANNLTNNLKQNVVYEHINIFLQKLLLSITQNNSTPDIKESFLIFFFISICADCSIACTFASVLPAPTTFIFSFKYLYIAFSNIS